jgi:hypothetical protein
LNPDSLVSKDYLAAQMAGQRAYLDTRFAEQDAKFDKRFAEIDARLDALRAELKADFDGKFRTLYVMSGILLAAVLLPWLERLLVL